MRGRNRLYRLKYLCFTMVGAEGFESPTLCSQNRISHLWLLVEISGLDVLWIEGISASAFQLIGICGPGVL